MSKSICALTHRADLSRETFQRYYEERHAPLAIGHFPFSRYVRNHAVDAPDCGFDTISEFWADDIGAVAALMDGPVGETMRADEERFMDRARIAAAGAEAHRLSAGREADADGLRTAVLIDWGEGEAATRAWASAIAARTSGVLLDVVRPWGEPRFPADAVLWLPGRSAAADPPAGVRARAILVRRVETPAEELRAGATADH